MAISTVDLFKPQPLDGVGQILAGGNNALISALNNSVQIGRDAVNLRASQERDFLAERERVETLNQRRAENLMKDAQIDRAFYEDVYRDARDTKEKNEDDERDFDFQVAKDKRDAKLNRQDVLSLIGSRKHDDELEDKKHQRSEEETSATKALLQTRANDILTKVKQPNLIARMFGAEGPLPEDSTSLGKELKEIGVTLRDPALISRGDEIVSQGTRGMLKRKEDLRNNPVTRSSSKKVLTVEERLVELDRLIRSYEEIENDPEGDGLSYSDKVKKAKALTEMDDLRKTLSGKPADEKAPESFMTKAVRETREALSGAKGLSPAERYLQKARK
jgi:hypothetical protein